MLQCVCASLFHQQYLFYLLYVSYRVFSVTLSGMPDETFMAQLSQVTIAGVMTQLSPIVSDFSAMLVSQQAQLGGRVICTMR